LLRKSSQKELFVDQKFFKPVKALPRLYDMKKDCTWACLEPNKALGFALCCISLSPTCPFANYTHRDALINTLKYFFPGLDGLPLPPPPALGFKNTGKLKKPAIK